MRRLRNFLLTAGLVALAVTFASGYAFEGPKWAINPVPYYVNPVNNNVTPAAAIAALQVGASAWSLQSTANISLYYAGQATNAVLANDGMNTVFFRNTAN